MALGIDIPITLDDEETVAVAQLSGDVLHIHWEDAEAPHAAVVEWDDFRALMRLLAHQHEEVAA